MYSCHAGRAKTTRLQSCSYRAQLCYRPRSLFLHPRVYQRNDTRTVTMETPLAGTRGGENGVHFSRIHTCTKTELTGKERKTILLLRDEKKNLLIYSQSDHKRKNNTLEGKKKRILQFLSVFCDFYIITSMRQAYVILKIITATIICHLKKTNWY